MKRPRPTIASLSTRVEAVEADVADLKREQLVGNGKIDSLGDKVDLLISMQSARLAARTKVICTLITAIGTTLGLIVGSACT